MQIESTLAGLDRRARPEESTVPGLRTSGWTVVIIGRHAGSRVEDRRRHQDRSRSGLEREDRIESGSD